MTCTSELYKILDLRLFEIFVDELTGMSIFFHKLLSNKTTISTCIVWVYYLQF
jgi:hypothetical protein